MSKLLALTSKKIIDVGTFMKENASVNKLRYQTEAGTTHRIFFPSRTDENGDMGGYIMAVPVHAWGSGSNFDSCICTKGVKDEASGFDGTCAVCERLNDASDIVKYVKAEKEAACTLAGEARKKFLEELDTQMWRDRKVSPAKQRYYVALALLACDKDGKSLKDGDGPKFTIHIASWTENTLNKFLDALKLQDDEENIGGREFKIMYGEFNDPMTRVGQSKVAVVDEKKSLVREGTPLYDEIMEAIAGFDFERSVELCRPEVKDQTPADIKVSMNTLFREWDTYKADLAVNPNAKYLEYSASGTPGSGDTQTAAPSAPAGALTDGAQAGTTGGEVNLDDLDAALGIEE